MYSVPSLIIGSPIVVSHISLIITSILNIKIPPKFRGRNRVFNVEKKHTLLDFFTVIPTLQFFTYRWRYLVPNNSDGWGNTVAISDIKSFHLISKICLPIIPLYNKMPEIFIYLLIYIFLFARNFSYLNNIVWLTKVEHIRILDTQLIIYKIDTL